MAGARRILQPTDVARSWKEAMRTHRLPAVVALTALISALVMAGPIEKKYPDGTVEVKYSINDEGDKEGAYEEFYASGQTKVKANYKTDKLDGPYKSFHENGKALISATYKGGKLSGLYTELTDQGLKKLVANYKDGKRHGVLTQFEKGKPVLTQGYKEDQLVYPRGVSDIKNKLAEILRSPAKPGTNPEEEAGFRRLKAYRYLVEVPYENLELDKEASQGAQAAAAICEKLGRLDHQPKNPGLPEAEYKLALSGAQHSNLAMGYKSLDLALDGWMDDAAPMGTPQHLGHRQWCINPQMQKVGFGKSGTYYAMWAHDRSQKMVPDYDFICFPGRGLMPLEFFSPSYYWNVSLNPKKFRPPSDTVKPKIYAINTMLNKVGDPLTLDYSGVNNGPSLPPCIIFRPDKRAVAPGLRYLVEIDGLTGIDDKPAEPIWYVVEFAALR
jgi:hypothetical protein